MGRAALLNSADRTKASSNGNRDHERAHSPVLRKGQRHDPCGIERDRMCSVRNFHFCFDDVIECYFLSLINYVNWIICLKQWTRKKVHKDLIKVIDLKKLHYSTS